MAGKIEREKPDVKKWKIITKPSSVIQQRACNVFENRNNSLVIQIEGNTVLEIQGRLIYYDQDKLNEMNYLMEDVSL